MNCVIIQLIVECSQYLNKHYIVRQISLILSVRLKKQNFLHFLHSKYLCFDCKSNEKQETARKQLW